MVRAGRHHGLTAVLVCARAMASARAPCTGVEVARVAQALRRAWRRVARRRAPEHVEEHVDVAPSLSGSAPERRRRLDMLPSGASVPQPAKDARGRALHAFAERCEVLRLLFDRDNVAIVWNRAPALCMVKAGERVYALKAGMRAACVPVGDVDAADRLLRSTYPGDELVTCCVFER